MKITGDRTRCVGAGQCVMFAPDLFTQDDDLGLVVVLVPEPTAQWRNAALAAQRACPTLAVNVIDDDGSSLTGGA